MEPCNTETNADKVPDNHDKEEEQEHQEEEEEEGQSTTTDTAVTINEQDTKKNPLTLQLRQSLEHLLERRGSTSSF